MNRRLATWFFIVALLVGSFLRGQDLLESYENGHRGACAAFFSLMARNHLRYGLTTTGGVAVINLDRVDIEHLTYYLHHPPGAIYLATLGALVGGTNPAGLRLAFLPLSIGIVLLIYRLTRRRGRATAAAAGALAATAPLAVYYGAFVNFEIPTLFFLLLSLHLLLRYRRRGRRKDLVRSAVVYAAAVFCDWIALGLPFCLMILLPLQSDSCRKPVRQTLGQTGLLLLIGVFVFLVVQAQYAIQLSRYGSAPDASGSYYRAVTPLAKGFDLSLYLDRISGYAVTLIGPALLILAGLGLVMLLIRSLRMRLDDVAVVACTFLTIGAANELILAQNALGHDYYLLYLLPAVSILAATAFCFQDRNKSGTLRAKLSIGLLIGVLGWQTFESVEVLSARRGFDLAVLGDKIANESQGGTVILVAGKANSKPIQVAAAAARFVLFVHDRPGLEESRRIAEYFGMVRSNMQFLIERGKEQVITEQLHEHLEQVGERRETEQFIIYELGPVRQG